MLRFGSPALLLLLSVLTVHGQTITVDNADPGFSILAGTWMTGAYGVPVGADYRWVLTTAAGGTAAEAEWRPALPAAGDYEVAVHYVSGPNRASDAPFCVHHAAGESTFVVNQQVDGGAWVVLGTFAFPAGAAGSVSIGNAASPTVVIADAVRFRRTDLLQIIPHDDPRVAIDGALFPSAGAHATRLDRIAPGLLQNPGTTFAPSVAVLTTGVTIRFRTDSTLVRARFNHLSYVITSNTGFVVFQDGVLHGQIADPEEVEIASYQPGIPTTFEIVCPSYSEVTLAGLELDVGATLYPIPPDHRLRYFALGDSITHGSQLDADTKADSTASYAWMLGRANGWHTFNLGVGGSQVTPAFGGMLAGQRADVVTILWGLNDKARDNDLALFVDRYGTLLDNLRAAQPYVAIYCITMTTTASDSTGSGGYSLEDYRAALAGLVSARQAGGDCHLHLLRGEEMSSTADLADGAHFTVEGAGRFAVALDGQVGPLWGDLNGDGHRDVQDWVVMAGCVSGPGVEPTGAPCDQVDWDCDGDIDLVELSALQRVASSR